MMMLGWLIEIIMHENIAAILFTHLNNNKLLFLNNVVNC